MPSRTARCGPGFRDRRPGRAGCGSVRSAVEHAAPHGGFRAHIWNAVKPTFVYLGLLAGTLFLGSWFHESPGWSYRLEHHSADAVASFAALLRDPGLRLRYSVVHGSASTHRGFVEELEKSEAVRVYARLPGWFEMPTPFGTCNHRLGCAGPQGLRRVALLLVVETKSILFTDDLRWRQARTFYGCQERRRHVDAGIAAFRSKRLPCRREYKKRGPKVTAAPAEVARMPAGRLVSGHRGRRAQELCRGVGSGH